MPGQGSGSSAMDVDSLLQSLVKGGRKGKAGGTSSSGGGKANHSKECFNCGKPGHFAAECLSPKKDSANRPSKPKFDGECNVCGKKGHKAVDCWHNDAKGHKAGKGAKAGKRSHGKHGKGVRSLEEELAEEAGGLDLSGLELGKVEKYCVDGYLKLNYDTGAAVVAFPAEFNEGGESTGVPLVTASGERIADMGEIRLQGRDEYNQPRKIRGKVTQVHKVLAGAAQINRDGRQRTWLTDTGGYLLPKEGPIAKGVEKELQRLIRKHGSKSLLPLYVEKGVYNFYLKMDKTEAIAAVDQPAQSGGSPASAGANNKSQTFARQAITP